MHSFLCSWCLGGTAAKVITILSFWSDKLKYCLACELVLVNFLTFIHRRRLSYQRLLKQKRKKYKIMSSERTWDNFKGRVSCSGTFWAAHWSSPQGASAVKYGVTSKMVEDAACLSIQVTEEHSSYCLFVLTLLYCFAYITSCQNRNCSFFVKFLIWKSEYKS